MTHLKRSYASYSHPGLEHDGVDHLRELGSSASKRQALPNRDSVEFKHLSSYQDDQTSSTSSALSELSEIHHSLQTDSFLDETPAGSNPIKSLASAVKGSEALRICIGMLTESRIEFLKLAFVRRQFHDWGEGTMKKLLLRFRPDAVTMLLPTMDEVGILDSRTSKILNLLKQSYPDLLLEPFLTREDWEMRSPASPYCSLKVTIYALDECVDDIGNKLSENSFFLQEPISWDPTARYYNPHVLSWSNERVTARFIRPTPSIERFAEKFDGIINSLESTELSLSLEQDHRIRSKLQDHQVAALKFMILREDSVVANDQLSLWEPKILDGNSLFVHKITLAQQPIRTCECRGGILSDDMGMGKSLSTIALVLHTQLQGYSKDPNMVLPCDSPMKSQDRLTTLIIAPKSTLHNWKSQLNEHLNPDTLTLYIYHGQSTTVEPRKLLGYDIVVTTYETVRSDFISSGVLPKVPWFRIVLDEAHQIRNRSTKMFQAIMNLQAERRWCLTGTPIQNSLDDLFSLMQFLRFHPFEDQTGARKYILEPFSRHEETALTNLRLAMRAIALRRTRQQFHFNRRRDESVIHVELNTFERSHYISTLADAQHLMRIGGSQRGQTLLRSISRLRQLCSHGLSTTFKSSSSISKVNTQFTPNICDQCQQPFLAPHNFDRSFENPCGHKICLECLDEQKHSEGLELSSSIINLCYVCHEPTTGLNVGDPGSNNATDTDSDEAIPPFSSKIKEVVSKLTEFSHTTSEGSGLEPIKCLVFSHWTRTLDSLEGALRIQKLAFCRVDGSLSLEQRRKIIRDFESQLDLRILLLSYGSGSVGLNLSIATHVHLVEPHWNPMVEAQAAARVDRLDQKKDIHIFRYIVKDSIEERIQKTQESKIRLVEKSVLQSHVRNDSYTADITMIEKLLQ